VTRSHVAAVPAMSVDPSGSWLRAAALQREGVVIAHVASSSEDLPRLISVIAGIDRAAAFDQVVLDVGAGPSAESTLGDLGGAAPVLGLRDAPRLPEDVEGLLDASRADVLVLHVDDVAGLCCALAAARRGISIVRVGDVPVSGPGRVVARLADLQLTRAPADRASWPSARGRERAVMIGNPLIDLVRQEARAALAAAVWRRWDLRPGSYALAVFVGAAPLSVVAPALMEMAARQPLILEAPADYEVAGAERLVAPSFVERLSLERAANSIVTDSARVLEEAAAIGVPCRAAAAADLVGSRDLPLQAAPWHGRAGQYAADALVANFARVRLGP
jgi:hypothetical protein